MRKFILNILAFLFFSVLFAIVAVFLPPRLWDAAVVLFCILIFLNKKLVLVVGVTLIAGLFFEIISNASFGIQTIALFASLSAVYLLKNQFLKLNRYATFLLNIAFATIVYRLSQIIMSAIIGDFSAGFFQTVYHLTDMRLILLALIWNICLSVIFAALYNALRKRFFARFFILR